MNYEAWCQAYTTIEDMTMDSMLCDYREVQCKNYRSCRKIGLIKAFIESYGAVRHIYSNLSSRVHGMHKTCLCSEKCNKILEFGKFGKFVSEKKMIKPCSSTLIC